MNRPIDMMKRILKDPLLHFLFLGAGLFVAYSLMQKPSGREMPGEILITQGQVEHLAVGFTKAWQRPPTPTEMAGLVRDRVREEVYYREAIAMGLDKDDTVIRRRLRQKMEFVSEDIAAQIEPTEEQLATYLQAHPEKFRSEARFSFSQVYLSPAKRGDKLAADAAQLLAQLQLTETSSNNDKSDNNNNHKNNTAAQGDPLMLGPHHTNVRSREVANLFGAAFASKLEALAPGQWRGPIESGYGAHLVRIHERTESVLPEVAVVRDLVQREWANAQRLEANEAFYRELLKGYNVTVEGLEVKLDQNTLSMNNAQ